MGHERGIRLGAKMPHLSMQLFQRQQCHEHHVAKRVVLLLSGS
jgi:hypothetical protein